jgi:uncharacterized protein
MSRVTAQKRDDEQAASTMPWSHGRFCWNELLTHDPERAKDFYAKTVGWTFEPMPMQDGGTYWVVKADGKPAGGIFTLNGPDFAGVPEGWMPYLAVDDVDKRVTKALESGAALMRPIFDIPNIGRIAILREPDGARIGMTPAW